MLGKLRSRPRFRLTGGALALSGLVVSAGILVSSVQAGAPSAGAIGPANLKSAASKARVLFKARAPASELKRTVALTVPLSGASIYRYQQRVDGLPVLGAQAAVIDGAGPGVALVMDSTRAGITDPPEPTVGRGDAIQIATGPTPVSRLRLRPKASLGVAPGDGGTLVWQVTIAPRNALQDRLVSVDATTGEVVDSQSLVRDASAKLYTPNPVEKQNRRKGLKDRRDRNTKRLTRLRTPVKLKRRKRGQRCLKGKWAEARLDMRERKVCKRNSKWKDVKRRSNVFEALMGYYTVDKTQNHLREMGFRGNLSVNARRQPVITSYFAQDNSFYSGADRKLRFGDGGVDDAEDGDVIAHEYGHAMQDAQVRGFGNTTQGGAMGEGFGDYMAAIMSRTNGGSNQDNVCIFDWDGVTYGSVVPAFSRKCGRRADNDDTFAQASARCNSSIHCLGEIWSSALWYLRRHQVGWRTDRIVILSHEILNPNSGFNQGANALLCADEAIWPIGNPNDCVGQHFNPIYAETNYRGFN